MGFRAKLRRGAAGVSFVPGGGPIYKVYCLRRELAGGGRMQHGRLSYLTGLRPLRLE